MTILNHKFKFWEDRSGYEFKDHEVDLVIENITYISKGPVESGCYFLHMNDGAGAQLSKEEYERIKELMIRVAGDIR